ncbi:E3 ubiquitin-protein ligase ATL31-like [Silene latifolia]|uniref:E3 ubiquitin-protein ligase ATL31-like n=1 Tax=Silene latifolia TaxID=37657 RepID=UPI003D7794A4
MPIQTHPTPTSHACILLCFSLLLSKPVTAQTPPPSPPSSDYNFSPPMATAVIILIIFFFSVGFISVYIRHFMLCLGYTPGRGFSGGIEAWRNERSPRGLDPKIVDTFPTFLYSDVKMHRIGKSLLECAICLSEFTDLETLRMLPSCSHVFHPHCVGPWLASHVTCPVCRANLENHSSDRSLSFNYLTQQFEQSSEEDEIESSHHNRDVIIRVGTSSPEDNKVIRSPVVQEIRGMDDPVGKLPRSHSTGHSLVEDCERYTLRLPDEVRNKLVNAKLSGLPAAIVSPRVGYRARSVGCPNIGVGGMKPDHWRFSVSPPFISRSGSSKSQKSNNGAGNNSSNNESNNNNNNNNNNSSLGTMTSPMNLFKSIKSPFNQAGRSDEIGERSTNRLWVSRTSQDLELEAQWHHDQ